MTIIRNNQMALRPLKDNFIFEFTNETRDGKFIEKSKFGFYLTNQRLDTQMVARWAKVIAIGDEVTDFGVGDYVLIEQGMWTTGLQYEGRTVWKSDQKKVCLIGEDESVTYTC
jgi:co-chaperonin GroES (HSP10)